MVQRSWWLLLPLATACASPSIASRQDLPGEGPRDLMVVDRPAPPPPPPPTAVQREYIYNGGHPIPDEYGGGWCIVEGAHSHPYLPVAPDQYISQGGGYEFRNDVQWWDYEEMHPIPVDYGGGWCEIVEVHHHHYRPWLMYWWNPVRRAYVYVSDARPVPGQHVVRGTPRHPRTTTAVVPVTPVPAGGSNARPVQPVPTTTAGGPKPVPVQPVEVTPSGPRTLPATPVEISPPPARKPPIVIEVPTTPLPVQSPPASRPAVVSAPHVVSMPSTGKPPIVEAPRNVPMQPRIEPPAYRQAPVMNTLPAPAMNARQAPVMNSHPAPAMNTHVPSSSVASTPRYSAPATSVRSMPAATHPVVTSTTTQRASPVPAAVPAQRAPAAVVKSNRR